MSETTDQTGADGSTLPPPYAPPTQDQPTQDPPAARPALRRSRSDRMVAGVAGGLARSFGVDPVVFRVIFAVLAIIGGSGLLLYVLLWLLVPEEDSDGTSAADRWVRSRSWSTATVLLLAVGLAVVTGVIIGLDPTPLFLLGIIGVVAFLLLRRNPKAGPPPLPVHYGPAAPAGTYAATDSTTRPYAQPTQPYAQSYAPAYGQSYGPPVQPSPAQPGDPASTQEIGMTQTYETRPYAQLPPPTPPYVPPVAYAPPPAPKPPKERSALGVITLGAAAVTAGVLMAIRLAGDNDAPTATAILAATTLVLGLGLLVGTFVGRARWLVIPAVFLVLATAGSSAADDFDGPRGSQTFAPTTAAEVRSTYDWGAGRLVIDLSDVQDDPDLTLSADLGVGSLRVVIPEDAQLRGTAQAGVGSIRLPNGQEVDGLGQEADLSISPPESGSSDQTITLDLEVGIGEVVISRA